jgi:hypothetical protein
MEWIIGIILGIIFLIFFGTRFPIKDDVMTFCPRCHAYVWCERTVYPDVVYYRCKRNKTHRFQHRLTKDSGPIEGDKKIDPPKGYNEDDV